MFWKANSDVNASPGYVGYIFKEGRDAFSLGLYRDPAGAYFTWYWDEIIIPPVLLMIAINEFVSAAKLPMSSDHATIVITDIRPDDRNHVVPMPLTINERGFLDDLYVDKLRMMRIDVPDPMPPPRQVKTADETVATETTVGAAYASFLVNYDGPEVHLAIAGKEVPAEHIAKFYICTTGRILTKEEYERLVQIIQEMSIVP